MNRFLCCILVFLLSAKSASSEPPDCPVSDAVTLAPSAGCLTVLNGYLLVIKAHHGKVSIPGGSVETTESAQCGAHRETWEETGLSVKPQALLRVFDNGFHLFQCQPPATSQVDDTLKPPFWLEIHQAFWLKPEDFGDHHWRFPNQRHWLAKWIKNNDSKGSEAVSR